MNRYKLLLSAAALLWSCTLPTMAQMRWEDPLQQTEKVVRGRAWNDELADSYNRLPERAKELVRPPLWSLSRQGAGLSVVFVSNAPQITVRYTVDGSHSMQHMPATGVSGVDLYGVDAEGEARWCAAKFSFGDTITFHYRGLTYSTDPQQGYEYHLYLPLYNHVNWMQVGVPADALFRFVPLPQERPMVLYGTSIAQGACASRPGMAWSNILSRELRYPLVNLGFSGNGQLEPELFDLLNEIDASLYIIDCLPNMTNDRTQHIVERVIRGVEKLRANHSCPILLVEHSGYTNEFSSAGAEALYRRPNEELRHAFDRLQQQGVDSLYYLTKEQIGLTMDAMVEGVHPSDLGMRQYADGYLQAIKAIWNKR